MSKTPAYEAKAADRYTVKSKVKGVQLKLAATLRTGTASSQDELRCSAIHKFNSEGNGARLWQDEHLGAGLWGLVLGGGSYSVFEVGGYAGFCYVAADAGLCGVAG